MVLVVVIIIAGSVVDNCCYCALIAVAELGGADVDYLRSPRFVSCILL